MFCYEGTLEESRSSRTTSTEPRTKSITTATASMLLPGRYVVLHFACFHPCFMCLMLGNGMYLRPAPFRGHVTHPPGFPPLTLKQTKVAQFLVPTLPLRPPACNGALPVLPVVFRVQTKPFSHKFLQGPEGKRIGDPGPMGRILIRCARHLPARCRLFVVGLFVLRV